VKGSKEMHAGELPEELKWAALAAVAYTVAGDGDGVTDALKAVGAYGDPGLFTAFIIWAEAARTMWFGTDVEPEEYAWGFHAIDNGGEVADPDALGAQMRGPVWSMRFLMAVANRDIPQALALYKVARAGTFSDDGPSDLLAFVARLTSQAEGDDE
jgi:hypothetical protein